jgi:hypothetical protein
MLSVDEDHFYSRVKTTKVKNKNSSASKARKREKDKKVPINRIRLELAINPGQDRLEECERFEDLHRAFQERKDMHALNDAYCSELDQCDYEYMHECDAMQRYITKSGVMLFGSDRMLRDQQISHQLALDKVLEQNRILEDQVLALKEQLNARDKELQLYNKKLQSCEDDTFTLCVQLRDSK